MSNDPGLEALLARKDLTSLLDLGATAPDWALALHNRTDCTIAIADCEPDGSFTPSISRRAADYRQFLLDHEVSEDRIRILRSFAEIRPVDAVVTRNGFGDGWKIKHIKPVMGRAFHSDSVMVLDIRKGSGAYPFLNGFGSCATLVQNDSGDRPVTRVVFTPNPPEPEADAGWAQIARGLAGKDGFYTEGNGHSFLYIPRSQKTLVVTFDNLDIAMNKRDNRRPWGYEFIEKQGWSMLGVMSAGWSWYRDPFPLAEFDRLKSEGFFARFERVVFYGASMGGYAAAAFSSACPGCDVVAISPQSTVDKTIVPWETRYRTVWGRDFSGPYGDAARVSDQARQVTILFDPYEPLDKGHVDRFTHGNVVKLRCPLMGHRLGSSLSQMGLLNPIILAALDGSLSKREFYRRLRARRDFPRYQKELFDRALRKGHIKLAMRLGRWVLNRSDNRHIRLEMKRLNEATKV